MIVEDGTGRADANSYADLWSAAEYFTLRGELDWFGGAAVAASGTLTAAANAVVNGTVTVGDVVYTFVTEGTTLEPGFVVIGSTVAVSLQNLAAAISADRWAIAVAAADSIGLIAKVAGAPGNDVKTLTNMDNLSWAAPTLTGGTQTRTPAEQEVALIQATTYFELRWSDNVQGDLANDTQALLFPRLNLPACARGQLLPQQVKQATFEYAIRALSGPLLPDPIVDPSGYAVRRKREKVGPIEEETEYAAGIGVGGGLPAAWPSYPAADRAMSCLWIQPSGVRNGRAVRA